jgi:hypothetical protein
MYEASVRGTQLQCLGSITTQGVPEVQSDFKVRLERMPYHKHLTQTWHYEAEGVSLSREPITTVTHLNT